MHDYDPGDNARKSYDQAIAAIRLDGVKAGRFLPLHDRPDEIKASPIVSEVRQIGNCTLYNGDSTRIVELLAEVGQWIDACVTDPPYELGFMGKSWDSSGVAADWRTWGGVRIAMKPGAHLVAFAGSRTYHRIAKAIDDAGFEVRDQIMWIYGSGFPKSLDVAKDIDKRGGVWRGRAGDALAGDPKETMLRGYKRSPKGEAVFDDAKRWEGWGTALKPAHEPVCFARKPLAEGTVAANVLRWATGAINIDGARVPAEIATGWGGKAAGGGTWNSENSGLTKNGTPSQHEGRWPANVLTDGSLDVLEAFPASARDAIRFFYSAKAGKDEREEGLRLPQLTGEEVKGRAAGSAGTLTAHSGIKNTPRANHHPTVKPVDLMRWLCRLVTPPGGIVLDPFMGSGSTGVAAVREGFGFVGVERDPGYFEICCQRIEHAVAKAAAEPDMVTAISNATALLRKDRGQGELF